MGGALGYLLPIAFDPIKRALVDSDLREERVRRRSREVFLQEEVFNTRERTGILLYVSMFERRLEVLADSGIRLMVPGEAWDEIVDLMTEAFDRGDPSAGLLAAVDRCGQILGRERPLPIHRTTPTNLPTRHASRRKSDPPARAERFLPPAAASR